jgi:hypothetical protein
LTKSAHEGIEMARVEKFKREATVLTSVGTRLDVNFFLSHVADSHLGNELVLDILNSGRAFIPLEDVHSEEIIFLNKDRVMAVELAERDLVSQFLGETEVWVWVELVNGDLIDGFLSLDMPPTRSRLSDHLNLTPQFIYLCRHDYDYVINKSYILSVKHQ